MIPTSLVFDGPEWTVEPVPSPGIGTIPFFRTGIVNLGNIQAEANINLDGIVGLWNVSPFISILTGE